MIYASQGTMTERKCLGGIRHAAFGPPGSLEPARVLPKHRDRKPGKTSRQLNAAESLLIQQTPGVIQRSDLTKDTKELLARNEVFHGATRVNLADTNCVGIMISLRRSEPGSDRREHHHIHRKLVADEIYRQETTYYARARCTATDLLRSSDSNDSSNFTQCWRHDALNAHMEYNEPQKKAPHISILSDDSYDIPLMFFLREKKMIHDYVEGSPDYHQGASFKRIVKHFQEFSASFRLDNANDARLRPCKISQLVMSTILSSSRGKGPANEDNSRPRRSEKITREQAGTPRWLLLSAE